jgi:PAS domain S-box-containing protein
MRRRAGSHAQELISASSCRTVVARRDGYSTSFARAQKEATLVTLRKRPRTRAGASLRKLAEKKWQMSDTDITKLDSRDLQRLVHELQTRQAHLELQNERLRHNEIRLAEARDHFSLLYEFAPIGYVTINQAGKVLESNLTAAAMFGVEREDLLGGTISRFVSPGSQDAWHLARQAAFAREGKHDCEIEMCGVDRAHLWVRLEGIVFGPENDRRCRMALIDVTVRTVAEEVLSRLNVTLEQRVQDQTAEIRLHAQAIAHIADGVMLTDGLDWSKSTIRFVNDAMCRITGYAAAELIGKRRSILRGSATNRKIINRIGRELSAGNTSHAELVQYRKDGKPYIAELSITPVTNAAGRYIKFVSIHRDITERKQTEQELDQYRKDLRTMGSELMLAEERERRRLAEELHDSVGQAIFRARLKLDQLSIAEQQARELGAILEEVGRMMNTIAFELSPPVLHRLGLRRAIKSLSLDMQARYALFVEVSDDGLDIPLDERVALVVFRAVRELLLNVAKHAQKNRASLLLRRQGHHLQIVVKDRGKGFNPADRSRQVGARRFGLFSIRERLHYIGGTFEIESARGKGTSVTLTAPLATRRPRS